MYRVYFFQVPTSHQSFPVVPADTMRKTGKRPLSSITTKGVTPSSFFENSNDETGAEGKRQTVVGIWFQGKPVPGRRAPGWGGDRRRKWEVTCDIWAGRRWPV